MSLKNSGGKGVNSLNGLSNNVTLVAGDGSVVKEVPGNKIQISTVAQNDTLNDILTNGNTSSLSIVLTKDATTTTLAPTGIEIGSTNIGAVSDGLSLTSGKLLRSDVLASTNLLQSGTIRVKSNVAIDAPLGLTVNNISDGSPNGLTINTANNTISSSNNVALSASDLVLNTTNTSIVGAGNVSLSSTNSSITGTSSTTFISPMIALKNSQSDPNGTTLLLSNGVATIKADRVVVENVGGTSQLSCANVTTGTINSGAALSLTSQGSTTLTATQLNLPTNLVSTDPILTANSLVVKSSAGRAALDVQGSMKVDSISPSTPTNLTVSIDKLSSDAIEVDSLRQKTNKLTLSGNLSIDAPVLNFPSFTSFGIPNGLRIEGIVDSFTPASTNPGVMTLSSGATLEVTKIQTNGDIAPVNISSINTGALSATNVNCSGLQVGTGQQPGNILCSGDCTVNGNLSGRNIVFDSSQVTDLTVTDSMNVLCPLKINGGITASGDVVFNPSGDILAPGKILYCSGVSAPNITAYQDLALQPIGNVVVGRPLSCSTIVSGLAQPEVPARMDADGKQITPAIPATPAAATDITLNPSGSNVIVATGKTLKTNTIGTTDSGDLTLAPTGNISAAGKTITCGTLRAGAITTATGDLTLSPATNVFINSRSNLVCNTIRTSNQENINLLPSSGNIYAAANVTATGNISAGAAISCVTLNVTNVASSGNLNLNPFGNITAAGKSITCGSVSAGSITTASGDLTLAPVGNIAATGKTITCGAVACVDLGCTNFACRTIMSGGDLTLNPTGNIVAAGKTITCDTLSSNTLSASGDLTVNPAGSNVIVAAGKSLRCDTLTASNDLTLNPAGTNVIIPSAKTLSCGPVVSGNITASSLSTNTINTAAGDLTLNPAGTNVILPPGKSLACGLLSTPTITTTGDLSLNPDGNVIIPSGKTLRCNNLTSSTSSVTIDSTKNLSCAGITAPADLTLAPTGNILATGKTITCSSVATSSGDLTLNPTGNIVVPAGSSKILCNQIESTGPLFRVSIGEENGIATKSITSLADLELNPLSATSSVVITSGKSLKCNNLSTVSGDLTLAPVGNIVATGKTINCDTVSASSTLVAPAAGFGLIGSVTGSPATDLTLSPVGNIVAPGKTITCANVSAGTSISVPPINLATSYTGAVPLKYCIYLRGTSGGLSYSFSRIGNLCTFIVDPFYPTVNLWHTFVVEVPDYSATKKEILVGINYGISRLTADLTNSILTYTCVMSSGSLITPPPAIWHAFDSRPSGASGASESWGTVTISEPPPEPEP